MKYIDIDNNELDESTLDLENAKLAPIIRSKSDAVPPDNITKFAYNDDEYEEAMLYIPFSKADKIASEIEQRKHYLTATDYCVIKIAEGEAAPEEYAETISKRKLAREEINQLEEELRILREEKNHED